MESNDHKLSRQLARLILDGGEASLPELKPALERILSGRSGPAARVFLKDFRKEVERQLRARTLVIESASELPENVVESVREQFQKNHEKTLQVTTRVNPSLIAGIKVQLGDDIYDATVANQLLSLSKSL
jgi:F-type H+-transporting ATPase subunit delta